MAEPKRGWEDFGDGTRRRVYGTYGQYVHHQKSKLKRRLETVRLGQTITTTFLKDEEFRDNLEKRLANNQHISKDSQKVLCLGARGGDEVVSFSRLGHDAIGIDLYPGPNNKYVIEADFHNMPFPDNSMDILYTNSIDHTHDVSKMLAEVIRVMKPDGIFLLEFDSKTYHGTWESFWWDSYESLVCAVEARGFKRLYKEPFVCKRAGIGVGFKIK